MASGEGTTNVSVAKLCRFLLTGQENGCYQPGCNNRQLSKDRVPSLDELIRDNLGDEAVNTILHFHRQKSGTRDDTGLFALALCARSSEPRTKLAAYSVIQEMCQLPRDLFLFVHYSETLSKPTTGWGKAQRRAISHWYNLQDPNRLAEMVTRYVSRCHWTHKDLMRLAHLKPNNTGSQLIAKYVSKGLDAARKSLTDDNTSMELNGVVRYLTAVDELKHTKDEQLAARLIENHGFHFEHVPSHFIKSKEVWTTLVSLVPVNVLLQYLPKLCQFGYLRLNGPLVPLVIEQLNSETANPRAKLHPVDVYLAMKKYEDSGKSPSGRPAKYRPLPGVMEALHNLFVKSFKNIPSTGKRFLIAVDVRNPMAHSKIPGCPQLTPAVAVALLSLGLLHAEPNGMVQVVAFSTCDMLPINLRSDMLLAEVTKCMREVIIIHFFFKYLFLLYGTI
uniref:TROVE domain-containing protein n=1 Tax=Strigamia maritima TaxID=126957 RepID=T1IM51_STRMM